MEIKRDRYLNLLISKKHNGLIKVITGMRRCGKSYLLFTLFKEYLLSEGIEILALLSGHRIWCSSFGIMCRAKSRTG